MATSNHTRKGVASLYIVIFTTLILGIITLSFMRIILSEATQTSHNDLSQSAYDSALAGVEDAKVALLQYHDCLSAGHIADPSASVGTCGYIVHQMQTGIAEDSCDTVAKTLGRTMEIRTDDTTTQVSDSGGEVIIQETQESTESGNSADMLQAYTCVKLSEELPDYRTTLNSDNRVRIIPLRSDRINEVKSLRISWFSDINRANAGTVFGASNLGDASNRYAPPIITVQLLQADVTFGYADFAATRNSGSANTDRATLYMVPKEGNDNDGRLDSNFISAIEFAATNDKAPSVKINNNTYTNGPREITCPRDTGDRLFSCIATVEMPNTFWGGERNQGATFLVVTLPYGQPTTDISIELCTTTRCYDSDNNLTTAAFTGVQARVDSTGRANDLYRRVETRVELVDVYYPFPEFAIEANSDDGTGDIIKSFYVTRNCWTSRNGEKSSCPNNQVDMSLSSF